MTQENHSSKSEDKNKTEKLEKEVENLQKVLELTRKTIEHEAKLVQKPTGHSRTFGKYEMI